MKKFFRKKSPDLVGSYQKSSYIKGINLNKGYGRF